MNVAQHKIINLLKTFFFTHQFLLAFVYLMCGPETPKDWTPLVGKPSKKMQHFLQGAYTNLLKDKFFKCHFLFP